MKALAEVKARQAAAEEAWLVAYSERSNLRSILHSLPVAVWVLDAEGTFLVANAEAERMQGFAGIGSDRPLNIFQDGRGLQIFQADGKPCEPENCRAPARCRARSFPSKSFSGRARRPAGPSPPTPRRCATTPAKSPARW